MIIMMMYPNKTVKGNFHLALLRSLLYDLREFPQKTSKETSKNASTGNYSVQEPTIICSLFRSLSIFSRVCDWPLIFALRISSFLMHKNKNSVNHKHFWTIIIGWGFCSVHEANLAVIFLLLHWQQAIQSTWTWQ